MNPSIDQTQASKAIRLVDYLLRLASLRTKVIRDISDYEKVLWISQIPHEKGCFTRAWGRDEEHEPDEWLEVQSQREPGLPTVPIECEDWVDHSSLLIKTDLPELRAEITRQVKNPEWREGSDLPEFTSVSERLDDRLDLQRTWEQFVETTWLPWAELHNRWESINRAYSTLFAIYQEQLRLGEEYELVLALGLLTWQAPTRQHIRRHLLVADAALEFEARLGRFTVRPHAEGAKLRPELDMLDVEVQPARAEEAAKSSLSLAGDDPWERPCIEDAIQKIVHSIDPQGAYDDSLQAISSRQSAKAVVEYSPALILRKRSTRGLVATLKRIRERIESGEDIPGEFADLAEIRPQNVDAQETDYDELTKPSDPEVYFPKPSNDEQRRIVDKIRAASGVLVQGPPGTGKSHTIANLICHLLATGQRILITAKTPRALQVLERLVPEQLRPLCINLLGSGLEERRSLESSVRGILRKNEQWNEEKAKRKIKELERKLRNLREEEAIVHRRLRDIRESEVHTQSIADGAYQGTASKIAEAVGRDRNVYDWFRDEIPFDKPCPITEHDLLQILSFLRDLTPSKRQELRLCCLDDPPSPERFSVLVGNANSAMEEEAAAVAGADEQLANQLSKNEVSAIESVRDALLAFQTFQARLLISPQDWMRDALHDVEGGSTTFWSELLQTTRDVIAQIEELADLADETSVVLPAEFEIRVVFEDVRKLLEHMMNGGTLGWGPFRPRAVRPCAYLMKSVRLNGRRCSTLDDFLAVFDALRVRLECEKAWGFWADRCRKTEGPYSMQLNALKGLCETLEKTLSLGRIIEGCRDALLLCPGIAEPVWSDEAKVDTFLASCWLALARHSTRHALEELRSIETSVSSLTEKENSHPLAQQLLEACRDRNIGAFSSVVNNINNFNEYKQRANAMNERVLRLRTLLPRLMQDLGQTYSESTWDNRATQTASAWHWAQATGWIKDHTRQEDVPALAKRARQIEAEINTSISRLASIRAWSYCFSRLEESHRRHMEAWQQEMKWLGKGYGKHAPRHLREAQQHLNKCREAVPAWVMPLHRVWDTIEPAPDMFDVVIVDEASQCGVEALPLTYLGKRILIVGDDKQISPDAVGVPRDAVHRLMEDFLYDFSFKSSFDIESSLFGHGKLRFGTNRIILREHFRCMPEIIRFSNDLCYSDTPLIPLRQYGPDRLTPLEHVRVSEGYREGSNQRTVNRPEAEAIVEKIVEMCTDRRYDGKTIGVVVLQGDAQAGLIEGLLLEWLGPEEMEKRRLICGSPYSFQGDERDVMILSLVAATNMRIGPLAKAADERRFNVAASRARDQVILFHSIGCEDLSTYDLRRRLLEFFQDTTPSQIAGVNKDELERRAQQDNRSIVEPPQPFESWFEIDVALEILRKGFIVVPQYEVAGKRIDLVIEGGRARLAVECDGDRWHGADHYEQDMQRQRQLERCDWEFFRVRGSAFYADRESALKGLWLMLEERGIQGRKAQESRDPKPLHSELVSPVEDNFESSEQHGGETTKDSLHWDLLPLSGEDDAVDPGRRVEEITTTDIQKAIVCALSKCANRSCTLKSLPGRALKELGVRTRGNPRRSFERRVTRALNALETKGTIEKYRAKNSRIRLS